MTSNMAWKILYNVMGDRLEICSVSKMCQINDLINDRILRLEVIAF